jgi:peptide/nickel transport system substrate-binding protein
MPAEGGTLTEGIIGTPRFINPLLEISDADRDMTGLIYSGLMRADNKGGLTPDLAKQYEISEDGLTYTFILRENIFWHDGKKVSSDDILFTIKQAQEPSLKSTKRASWEGIEIEKIDDHAVKFTLKKAYTPFLQNTTIGILPKHIWENALSERMIYSEFNTNPIGSGPYKIDKIKKDSAGIATSYILSPNKGFVLGKPNIKNVIFKFYPSEERLIEAYKKNEIDSLSAISPQFAEQIKKDGGKLRTMTLPRVFGVFFNQNDAEVFSNQEVREALNLAVDRKQIINEVLKGFGSELYNALPNGTLGAIIQETAEDEIFENNLQKAKDLLVKNGWKLVPLSPDAGLVPLSETDAPDDEEQADCEGDDCETEQIPQVFEKTKKIKGGKDLPDGKAGTTRLEFSISTSNISELKQTAELLKEMWEKLGAKVNLKLFEIGDLNQNVIRPRNYDSILFGEIVGQDPDPFVFWHSSQRNDPGLNIAMYANIKVDKLLEDARRIADTKEREEKYTQFQEELAKDIPAVFLYSPRFIYLVPNSLKGIDEIENITVPSERFSQIHKWHLKTRNVWKIFVK